MRSLLQPNRLRLLSNSVVGNGGLIGNSIVRGGQLNSAAFGQPCSKKLLPSVSPYLASTACALNHRCFSTEKQNENWSRVNKVAGVGGALALLWGKGKWFLAAAKLTKFTSVISMAASTGAYAFFFGWPFAVGMVGQIMLHESV